MHIPCRLDQAVARGPPCRPSGPELDPWPLVFSAPVLPHSPCLPPTPKTQRGQARARAAGQGPEGSRPQRPDAREAGPEAGRSGEKPRATPLKSRGQGSWRRLQLWTRSPRASAQRGREATLLCSVLTPRAVGLGCQGHRSLSRETRLLSPPTPHPRCPVSAGHPGPASPVLTPAAQPLEYLQLSHCI